MIEGQPSRTAMGAALHRAMHQRRDTPPVFADPLAVRIVGEPALAAFETGIAPRDSRYTTALRAFLAVRSRVCEEVLASAIADGVDQYVVLGAGLDTFAYRSGRSALRIFEVDHPATQAWKRMRLDELGIAQPAGLTFAAVDFESEHLAEGLTRAGFDCNKPAVFAWLGVVPYLSAAAMRTTLAFVAGLPAGSAIVFDYASEPAQDAQRPDGVRMLAERVAAAGEPLIGFHKPEILARDLAEIGFSMVTDLDAAALNAAYFTGRDDGLAVGGRGHVMIARV